MPGFLIETLGSRFYALNQSLHLAPGILVELVWPQDFAGKGIPIADHQHVEIDHVRVLCQVIATAGNRRAVLTVTDSLGNEVFRVGAASGTIANGQTRRYQFSGGSDRASAISGANQDRLPFHFPLVGRGPLEPGWTLQVTLDNEQAGDAIQEVNVVGRIVL